jgi:arylsulfatase A-like enzyme
MARITRREFVSGVASTAAAATLAPQIGAAAAEKRPNVLFIFYDQLRTDACGVYGGRNIATPNIDRLAAGGMRFSNAISSCPVCTPYRGMVQTGRYPTHSGILLNFVEAHPDQRCIGHLFRDAGYRTGFIGKWHLSAGYRRRAGKFEHDRAAVIDYYRSHRETEYVPPGDHRLGYDHWQAFNFHVSFRLPWYYGDEPQKLLMPGYESDGETELAMNFMSECRDRDQAFFLMVAPHPPHPPFTPRACPPGYLEKIGDELYHPPNVPSDHPRRTDELALRCYLAMCRNADDNVGRILDFLDQSDLADNTIVVFTSDHGEQHGSHGRINKMVPYAESLNIPLIMRWPGRIPEGTTSDALHLPMDHMATLCGMAGLDVPESSDGLDLSGTAVRGDGSSRDAALIMNYCSDWDFFQSGTRWPEWRGVRTRRHSYVRWLTGEEELYDNQEDPHQMVNLAAGGRDQPTQRRLRTTLRELLAEAHDEFLPGTAYADWYDAERNLLRTALGPVRPTRPFAGF